MGDKAVEKNTPVIKVNVREDPPPPPLISVSQELKEKQKQDGAGRGGGVRGVIGLWLLVRNGNCLCLVRNSPTLTDRHRVTLETSLSLLHTLFSIH